MGTFTQGIPILTQKCKVAYIWLVSNRLRLNNDSAGSRIKEEGMYVNSCLVALSYVARLSLLSGAIYCFLVHVVSTFFCFLFCFVFFFRHDCGLCCKSSTESFRIIIFWRILKSKTSMYRAQNNGRSTDNVWPDRGLDRSNSHLAGHFDRSFLDANLSKYFPYSCRSMRFAL